jgi:hypothetical protein
MDNNEASRRLWWASGTFEGVMNHILEGDYPRL